MKEIILRIWNLFNEGYTNIEFVDKMNRFVALDCNKELCFFDDKLTMVGKDDIIIKKVNEKQYSLTKDGYTFDYMID